MNNQLAIQFVNYKTKKYLFRVLKGLEKNITNLNLFTNIFILDNASGDDLSDLKTTFPNLGIHIYYSKKNTGFGTGHNYLAKKHPCKYLLILNPDIKFLRKTSLKRLLKRLQSKPDIAVVGPRLITRQKTTQMFDHGELKNKKAQKKLLQGGSFWQERKRVSEVAWVSGAVFLIKREVFDKEGGFDESFFLYKEEEDLCLRVRNKGYKIIYDPKITIMHYGGVVAKKELYLAQSDEYFRKKHLVV